jgi:hypothetical protein
VAVEKAKLCVFLESTLNQYQIVDFDFFLKFNVGFEQYSSSWYVTLTLNGKYSKTCKNGLEPQATHLTVLLPSCYDCAWLSLTALSTVTRNLWL